MLEGIIFFLALFYNAFTLISASFLLLHTYQNLFGILVVTLNINETSKLKKYI